MKQKLFKTMLLLCALVVGSTSVWGDTTVSWPQTTAIPNSATNVGGDANIQIKTSSSNSYTSPLRVYANTTITITALNDCVIKSVTYTASQTGNYVTYAEGATVTPSVTPTVSSKDVTWSYDEEDKVTTFTFTPSSQTRSSGISITYSGGGSSSAVATTTTIDDSDITNTDVYTSTDAGSLSASVTAGGTPVAGATVTWSSSDTGVATIGETTGVVTLVAAGTTTITATYAGVENEYQPSEKTYNLTVTNSAPATLPFNWTGGTSAALLAETGVTAYNLGDDYGEGNAPYRVKFDGTGDYIQIITDSQPDKVTIGVKMIGGSSSSSITVQESPDGTAFTDVEELTISGSQNDIRDLETTNSFAASTRYVRLVFTKGSNVGVGPITITKVAPYVAVTGVSLNEDAITLAVGDTETLTATVGPAEASNKNVTWESDDTDVATVDASGVVTAVAAGTANITVKTVDGDFTATCAVTVNTVSVTGVSVKASTTLEVGGTETLTPTFTPSNATNKDVTWESDDESVATVSAAGVVEAVAAGTANITVTTDDGDFTATCVVTVVTEKGTIDAPYSVAEVKNGTATGSDKYVEGYVVGYVTGTSSFTTTPASGNNSNWALADDPSEKSFDNIIPVQIVSTNQADYGLWNHPELIGAKFVVKGDITSYFSPNIGVKNLDEISAISIPVTVTSAGFATYCSQFALDFTSTAIEAYVGTIASKKLTFTPITQVPANTGLLLVKDGGATVDVPVIASAPAVGSNCLTGVNVETTLEEDDYILNVVGGKAGFYKAGTHTTLAAHRAYITAATGAGVKAFVFDFDDATGINAIDNGELTIDNAAIYNLAGQRLNKMQKGINIVNGKKILY